MFPEIDNNHLEKYILEKSEFCPKHNFLPAGSTFVSVLPAL